MKKHGFTLAEVLITLGLIGVVTSLIMPTFINNSKKATYATKLASTVSILENGFTTMMVKENANSLFETNMWSTGSNAKDIISRFNDYTQISVLDKKPSAYYPGSLAGLKANGAKDKSDDAAAAVKALLTTLDSGAGIILKNGAVVFLHPEQTTCSDAEIASIKKLGGTLYSKASKVVIDINGTSEPNTLGRDIFEFILGDNGTLYPVGSIATAAFNSKGKETNEYWNKNNSSSCQDNNIKQYGLGCTARVVEEGYKMNY